jgi:glycosyltransferase involved in cell wall biosynthesis
MYTISILMPCYNSATTIARAIDSIITQQGWYELIIVDDASTDDSWEIIQAYSKQHVNIKCIRLHENMGAGAARNVAATQATGEILAFLDADDTHIAGYYTFAQKMFMSVPSIAAIKVGTEFVNFPKAFYGSEFSEKKDSLLNTFIPNMMVKKVCFEVLGGFNPHPVLRRDGGEDGVFCYLLSQFFVVGTYYDKNYLQHHWHTHVHAEKFLSTDVNASSNQASEVVQISWQLIQKKQQALKHLNFLFNQTDMGFRKLQIK